LRYINFQLPFTNAVFGSLATRSCHSAYTSCTCISTAWQARQHEENSRAQKQHTHWLLVGIEPQPFPSRPQEVRQTFLLPFSPSSHSKKTDQSIRSNRRVWKRDIETLNLSKFDSTVKLTIKLVYTLAASYGATTTGSRASPKPGNSPKK